ncbi:hypothetical protein [Streptomyces sp.]|uniref:hypothetical protein n=1 Tax=Streptomyces sp. TaxID=1931 RepID=UPI002C1491AB|nr:hypothetical protein [Streptomyces sp.]HLL32366.1 hypothetical protein [Streptomyces sp.]HZF87229.1 hypothetical protein [Streptomyces sp.]
MLRIRIAQAAAVATLALTALLAAPAVAAQLGDADPAAPSVTYLAHDAGWQ